jgi:hypothetical protein
MLNYRQFDELRLASPFRPFRIVMSDGAKFLVTHREFAWRSPNGSTLVVATEDGEAAHLVDPLHVTRFELVPENGHRRKQKQKK